jgi:hypothetical protein
LYRELFSRGPGENGLLKNQRGKYCPDNEGVLLRPSDDSERPGLERTGSRPICHLISNFARFSRLIDCLPEGRRFLSSR